MGASGRSESSDSEVSLKLGDAFVWNQTAVGPHLWVVISDPEQPTPDDKILIVNFSSMPGKERYADRSCVISANEHPYLTMESWVNYDGAKLQDPHFVQRWCKSQPCLSDKLLNMVIAGAEKTDMLLNDYRSILISHGIIG